MRTWIALPLLLIGCEKPCLHMCQQYARYVDECGTDWASAFPEEDWDNVEDCYESVEDANDKRSKSCEKEAKEYTHKECY